MSGAGETIMLMRPAGYYNRTRTHLALDKDAPEPRAPANADDGPIVAVPEVNGLHHRYERLAA